ncbi:MAG: DUF6282 family protein [Peptococcaceae bacterium]|jgi:hypothetical protein|nr:DUF6282 family protein [Peptococcaceae bacterium]
MSDNHELAIELMKGAYDLHTHPNPSHFPRELDDFELIREADAFGMAGVMIKSHYEPTGARAWSVNAHAGAKARAYGGLVLNWPVGGLNPYAAASAIKMGAKCIWMPTRDSRHCLSFGDMPGDFFQRPGITIYDSEGKVADAVYQIFEVAKAEGVYVASGHLSPEETVAFCKAGADRKAGVILTHPDWDRTMLPLDIQLLIADMGVLVEKVGSNILEGGVTKEAMADSIRKIGAERIFMSTD